MPFLLDTLGNALNFYNTYDVTDDVLHFSNWVPLVAGLTLAVRRTRTPALAAFAMGCGFGGSAIFWWEEAEYLIMQAGSMGLNLTYGDTMGDLALSFSGGVVGAALASRFARLVPGSSFGSDCPGSAHAVKPTRRRTGSS